MHLRASAAAMVSLLAGACGTPGAPPSGGSAGTLASAPTAAASPHVRQTETPDPPLRAEGLRLLGSVPGSNADFAFWGDLAIVTTAADWDRNSPEDGLALIDISDSGAPRVVGSFSCAGSFQDVSVWDRIAVVSTDRITTGDECGAAPANELDGTAFAGLRIVSIEDPAHPALLASVATGVEESPGQRAVRGSHTNTIVPDLENQRLLVYASMLYHPDATPDATIVEIPLDDPASARIVGAFDNGTSMTCHDVTVHLPRRLAVCSGYTDGLSVFDISDLERPTLVSQVIDPQMAIDGGIWHSTVFSTDGRSLVVNAEIFAGDHGGLCPGGSDSTAGALRFYDIADAEQPHLRSIFQLPRRTEGHFCYAHQSGIVPIAGDRDVVVSGWFGGGVNLVDITDLASPRELAFWVAGEPDGGHSFVDSAYWYNGRIYAANLALGETDSPVTQRGFEVFGLDDGILDETVQLSHLNPQTQEGR